MKALPAPLAYVAHVKVGYESRRQSIESQMRRINIPFEFMLDGDISDVTPERKQEFFHADFLRVEPLSTVSCALKHLLIYQRIVASGQPGALVLEDDILLAPDFSAAFQRTLVEARQREEIDESQLFISYENSYLRFVPRSERKAGRQLYRAAATRACGAYYISRGSAAAVLERARTQKMNLPIDWFLNEMSRDGGLSIYWCEPTIAEQGSVNGTFPSSITARKAGLLRTIIFAAKKAFWRLAG